MTLHWITHRKANKRDGNQHGDVLVPTRSYESVNCRVANWREAHEHSLPWMPAPNDFDPIDSEKYPDLIRKRK